MALDSGKNGVWNCS